MYRLIVCVFASEEMQQSNNRLFERVERPNPSLWRKLYY